MGDLRAGTAMSGATILAVGAVSAFGAGDAAFAVGGPGDRARVAIEHDDALARAGFVRPIAARVSSISQRAGDRASQLLGAALDQCLSRLGEVRPHWRKSRVGLAIGTSSGGMSTAETFFAARARGEPIAAPLARGATYFAPLEAATAEVGVDFSPRVLVLGACASSTLAVGLALRWLELGRCEIALAGGFDAISEFVASGFEALRATTATRPRPFRVGRDGMALGEGAGVMALELAAQATAGEVGATASGFGYIVGFGASTDAVHITAPDKTGQGLARAVTLALSDAGLAATSIGVVSGHATATSFNDAAEAKSMRLALGEGPKLVHPFKAQIGHALGAAGILESLALLDATRRGLAPAAAGEGELDPECAVRLASVNTPMPCSASLKLSAAFGGANAALVFAPRVGSVRPTRRRPVFLLAFLTVTETFDARTLADRLGDRHPNLPRLDRLARLVLSAVHELSTLTGRDAMAGGGVILGHALATLEHNELFDVRRREVGPRSVEPRRFPATSPNAAAGECAIAFRLTGPSFAVGASLHGGLEALTVARDLVAAADAETMLVVAADVAGPASSEILRAGAGAPPIVEGACVALLGASPARPTASAAARDIEVPTDVPRTLGPESDWIWTGQAGHTELDRYLRGL